jgi:pyruvate,water dikinase
MKYLLRLLDPSATSPVVSGGKGANLAKLTQAGFPVPSGFVIAPAAYRDATMSLGSYTAPLRDIAHDDHEAIARASATIIDAIRGLRIRAELASEIFASCAEIGVDARWAVRSSGTAEDLAGAAFAGQHDTFLNCASVEIVQRVIDCWCSLWSPRAIAYRGRLGFDQFQVAMAVVVQQMADADAAGVAFTIDPVGGAFDTVVIDANFGLGESVVSGESEVDHLVVDRKSWTVTSRRVANKTTRIVAAATGTSEVHVDASDAARSSLTDEQAIAIARLAAEVEAHFGWPQDVEWAVTRGTVALLQSRPITTIPPRWTRDESAERFPNVVTPLTWDFVEEGFHRSLNHSFALMGLPEYDGKWFANFGHYIYGNQNAVELYARRSPIPPLPLPELVKHLPAIVERFRWIAELPARWHEELPRFLGEIDGFLAEPIEDYDLAALWSYVARVNAAGTRYFLPNIAISIGHGVLHRALRAIVSATTPAERVEEICSALVKCETMTTRVNEELRSLAALAVAEGVSGRLAVRQSEAVWSGECQSETPFWVALRRFLAEHGHRETDFDAYHPTWMDAPWVVLDHVRAMSNVEASASDSSTTASNASVEAAILTALPAALREIAARVVRLAREYTALDDLEHYHTTRLSRPLRRGVRAIGERLQALGIVEDPMDAFFASATVLAEVIGDARQMAKLRDHITETKIAYLRARENAPAWTLGATVAAPLTATDADASQLTGIPGSPGAAEGIVHIVRGTDDFAAFPRGAVLVARTTNPAWTPLFYSAAAVVTESGGPLSHGAVTAREMRIPAVMSVRGVLGRLRNGDRVRVDGASGLVEVLEAA